MRNCQTVLTWVAVTLGLFLALVPVTPVAAADLDRLLAQAAPDLPQAAVLCVLDPGGLDCATRGRIHPKGRATRPDDRFAVASVGKTVTAIAILQLVDRGTLGLNDPATQHLPSAVTRPLGGLKGVTIRHLLAMRSGLPDYYTGDYLSAVAAGQVAQTPRGALRFAQGPVAPPGRLFDYSNTNYVLLQMILERATGRSMADQFRRIFEAAGMRKTFVFGARALPADFVTGVENYRGRGPEDVSNFYQGQGFGDGALISTAPDIIRLYHALFVQKRLLSRAMLFEMTQAGPEGYGLGIAVEHVPGLGQVLGHSGADLGFVADARLVVSSGRIAVAVMAGPFGDAQVTYDALQP